MPPEMAQSVRGTSMTLLRNMTWAIEWAKRGGELPLSVGLVKADDQNAGLHQ